MVKIESYNPKVSVYMNTRNRAKLISRALNSVLNQTYQNFEIVIVDAASTDNTEEVVSNFILKDKRIRYYKYDNEKLATCLNFIITKCKGEYITQMDDDDEYLPEKIEKQVNLLENSDKKVSVVYCWEEFWDDKNDVKISENKPDVRGDAYYNLLEKSCVGGGTTMMMRKSAFIAVGGYDESIRLGADYQLNINLSAQFHHDFVPEVLVRTHMNHSYNRLSDMKVPTMRHVDIIEYEEKILSDHKAGFDARPRLRFNHYKSIMHSAAKANNLKVFFKYLLLGIKLNISFKTRLIYILRGIKHLIIK